jgi:hypothetical protein
VEPVQSNSQYVCIISYPRSGSSALANLINNNFTYIQNESNGLIIDICNIYLKIKSSVAISLYNLNGEILEQSRFKNYNIDLIEKNLREIFVDHFSFYKKDFLIKGWKENDISPIKFGEEKCFQYIECIKNIFPNIKFIFNIRNEIDTSKSGLWKRTPNAILEISRWIDFLYRAYKNNIDNSIFIEYDLWKNDLEYLNNKLNIISLNLDYEYISDKNFQLNHLKYW